MLAALPKKRDHAEHLLPSGRMYGEGMPECGHYSVIALDDVIVLLDCTPVYRLGYDAQHRFFREYKL